MRPMTAAARDRGRHNILVSAHRRDHPFHPEASQTLVEVAEGADGWSIPWPCIHEFLAIVTHPRIFDPPSTLTESFAQLDAWFESPTLVLLAERSDHWSHLRGLLAAAKWPAVGCTTRASRPFASSTA